MARVLVLVDRLDRGHEFLVGARSGTHGSAEAIKETAGTHLESVAKLLDGIVLSHALHHFVVSPGSSAKMIAAFFKISLCLSR